MTDQEPPKIEFPCDYPIKVLGRDREEYESAILEVFERHAPGFDRTRVTRNASSGGTFVSLTVTILATGPEQLSALHDDLRATGLVSMVI